MRIRRNYWKGWVRLVAKAVVVAGIWYGMFGIWFGVQRVSGNEILNDGDLIVYCRIGCDYKEGDLAVTDGGIIIRIGDVDKVNLAGKVIARLSVRGFYEDSEGD